MEQDTIVIDKLTVDMVTHISKIRQMVITGIVMEMNTIHYVPNSITEKEIDILVEILRSFSKCKVDDSGIDYTDCYIAIELVSTNEKRSKVMNKFIIAINDDANISKKVNEFLQNSEKMKSINALDNLRNITFNHNTIVDKNTEATPVS